MDVHPKWKQILEWVNQIACRYKGKLYDSRVGRSWDPGQAVCAEAYGPDWMYSEEFKKGDAVELDEAPDEKIYQAAKRLAQDPPPEWLGERGMLWP